MQTVARITLFCILLGLAPGPWEVAAGNLSIIKSEHWLVVAEVFDGDTFKATNGDIVRLLGIDCPEMAHRDKPGEPLAANARAALQELIGGQRVRLKSDMEKRDRYDRLLAQAYLKDGTWVNGELTARGWAYVYTFPPNMHWADALLELERAARIARRGIWNEQRFQVLDADSVGNEHLGQFRLIEGIAHDVRQGGFAFRLGGLEINVPGKYRRYFDAPPNVRPGVRVLARGTLRQYGGRISLALHSPADLEILSP